MKYARFKQLTVAQYQELYNINRSDADDLDKAIQSVGVLTGLASWQVEDLPLDEFTKISREIGIIFSYETIIKTRLQRTFLISGKRYQVIYNVRKLTAGQYIDIQTFLSGNPVENLHKIMACLVVPYKIFGQGKYDSENHEKIAEGIQDLNFCEVNAVCVFFSELWNNSIRALEPYLLQEIQKTGTSLSMTDLQSIMAGSIMPKG